MSDAVRNALKRVVADCGRDVIHDAKRCEGMLRDLAPTDRRRDINVLVSALRECAVDELVGSDALPIATRLDRAVNRLQAATGITDTVARWGIESWALVLGIITDRQLLTISDSRSPPPISPDTPRPTKSGSRTSTRSRPTYPKKPVAQNIGYILAEVVTAGLLIGLVCYLGVFALTFLVGWMIWGYLAWLIKAGGILLMVVAIDAVLENKMHVSQPPEPEWHTAVGGMAAVIGTMLLVAHASEFDQVRAWVGLVTIWTLAGCAARLSNRWLVCGVVFLVGNVFLYMLL